MLLVIPTLLYSAKLWPLLQSKAQQEREGTGLTLIRQCLKAIGLSWKEAQEHLCCQRRLAQHIFVLQHCL